MSTEISELERAIDRDDLSRVERKRSDARLRIIRAAERLMLEGPIDAVTIADITRAADVGHGSFYLHFKSKHEVLVPIVQDRAARWDAHVREHVTGLEDPVEVLAFTTRHMARAALEDPLWRWFLIHSGVPMDDMGAAVGRFGARDFQACYDAGRLTVPDSAVSNRFILGGYVSTLLGCVDLEADAAAESIDVMVELLLRALGLAVHEAADFAHRPLIALQPMTS